MADRVTTQAEQLSNQVDQAVRNGSEAAMDQVNTLLMNNNANGNADLHAAMTRQMENMYVLPNLMLVEQTRMDTDGNGRVDQAELQSIVDNRGAHRPTTVFAAEHALRNFDRIDASDEADWWWGSVQRFFSRTGSLNEDEFKAFAEKHGLTNAPARPADQPATGQDMLNTGDPASRTDRARAVLQSDTATNTERFRALEELARAGVGTITLRDRHGNDVQCNIAMQPLNAEGTRNQLSLSCVDPRGTSRLILRADAENGNYTRVRVGSL
jgi:hypothetical protein